MNKTIMKSINNSISNISIKNLPQDSNTQSKAKNELEKIQKDEIYRFCEVDKFEDEMSDVLFNFNEKVEKELKTSFCSNYLEIKAQLCSYDSIGIFYIRSNLTERMEGLVIYGCDKFYNTTILYVNSLFKAKFDEICFFVVKKLKKVFFPKKIKVRILNIFDDEKKRKVHGFVKDTFVDMGFTISYVTFEKKTKKKYSVYELKTEDVEKCKLRIARPKLNFKGQIVISNFVRLAQNVSKPRMNSFVDYRALVFFCFTSYFKKGYFEQRNKLRKLMCFGEILNHFEANIEKIEKLKVSFFLIFFPKIFKFFFQRKFFSCKFNFLKKGDKNLFISNCKNLGDYNSNIKTSFTKSFLRFLKLKPVPFTKKINISTVISKISSELKFCDKSQYRKRSYYRVRSNPETYRFISKGTMKEIYLIPCDNEKIALMIFPDNKIVSEFLKGKGSYTSFSDRVFSVNYYFKIFQKKFCFEKNSKKKIPFEKIFLKEKTKKINFF